MGTLHPRGASVQYQSHCPIEILDDIVVPKANNDPTFTLEKTRSGSVMLDRVGMLAAINLDDDLRLAMREIDDVRADDQLTREGRTEARNSAPQGPLGLGSRVAQATSARGEMFRNPSHIGKRSKANCVRLPTPSPSLKEGGELE